MSEITCYGEILIDLSQCGAGGMGFPAYEALPGGAPANVAVALSKWGRSVAFSGATGPDTLGASLRETLARHGVDTSRLATVSRPTTMAVVSLDARGDRSFSIYWQGTSCEGLAPAVPSPGDGTRIFHFGSVSMCDPAGARNTLESARAHRDAGCLVSFDPNLRERLWTSLDDARSAILRGLELADVVKISGEEVAFLLGEAPADPIDQASRFRAVFPSGLLFVTLGPKGCLWHSGARSGSVSAPDVPVLDTTGAGDCFMAGVLQGILERSKPGRIDLSSLLAEAEALAAFGAAAGSCATTRRGGIPAIPSLEEIASVNAPS